MQISANTSVKTIEGHCECPVFTIPKSPKFAFKYSLCCPHPSDTCHTKSVITKPQNVYVMRDIMCSGYVAGGNTMFFGMDAKGAVGPIDPSAIRNDMEARLSFRDDSTGEYKSMLAFCAPYGDGAKRDQVISISPRLLPWEVNRNDSAKHYFPGGENGNFDKVKTGLGLDTIHFGEDVRAAENMEFISTSNCLRRTRSILLRCILIRNTPAWNTDPCKSFCVYRQRLDEQRALLRRPAQVCNHKHTYS